MKILVLDPESPKSLDPNPQHRTQVPTCEGESTIYSTGTKNEKLPT